MIGNLFKRSSKKMLPFSALIVHDDAITARRISEFLVKEGHQALVASSSAEALQLLEGSALPDIFIIDLLMPDADGKIFLETARIRYGKSALPPVLILADEAQDERVARDLNAEDVLAKPFEDDDLLCRLTSMVEARRPGEQKAPARK